MPDQPSQPPATPPAPSPVVSGQRMDDPEAEAAATAASSKRRLLTWTLILLNATLVIFLLKWADAFFMPLVAGIFLSYTLGPIVDFLQNRMRLPRALGSAVAIVAFMGVIGGIGYAVWWQAIDLAESMPESINRITRSVRQVQVDRSSSLSKLNQALDEAVRGRPELSRADIMQALRDPWRDYCRKKNRFGSFGYYIFHAFVYIICY